MKIPRAVKTYCCFLPLPVDFYLHLEVANMLDVVDVGIITNFLYRNQKEGEEGDSFKILI